MEITVDDALLLLASFGERIDRARRAAAALEDARDELIAELDGQEGMRRTAMAEACGLTRARVFQVIQARRPDSLDGEGVEVSDDLRDALRDVFGDGYVPTADRLSLDVHA